MSIYTVSGDSEHVYVSDETGRIVATCADTDMAREIANSLSMVARREVMRDGERYRLRPIEPLALYRGAHAGEVLYILERSDDAHG